MIAAYDFESLSEHRFVELARDLLQAEWKVDIEDSVASEHTRGFDLHYTATGGKTTLIECKHPRRAGFRELLKNLQSGVLPTIRRLEPERFVLVTSLPLNEKNKDEIVRVFAPVMQGELDIYGLSELEDLLNRHPEVTRSYPELIATPEASAENFEGRFGESEFGSEYGGDKSGKANEVNPIAGAASFFDALKVPLTQALQDLLTIAAAYTRVKKTRQDSISSTCLLLAAADGWQDRIRMPTRIERVALDTILSEVRAQHINEFVELEAEFLAEVDIFQQPRIAGLEFDSDGLVDYESFDFSGINLSPNFRRNIEDAYSVARKHFDDDRVSIAHLLIAMFIGPSPTLVKRLEKIGVRAPEIAAQIGGYVSGEDPGREALWEDFGSGANFPGPRLSDLGRVSALSDTIDDSVDKLQFSAKANTFAKLIADESLRLPLAIGLFGNWGSGKSFFMNLVKNSISDITRSARLPESESSTYVRRIAQIDFNAWHYMDTNLWASMAARIYEGLLEELAGPRKSIAADVRAHLQTDIQSSKRQIEAAEAERKIALERQAEAQKELKRAQLEEDNTKANLGKTVIEIFQADESRRKAIKKVEKIVGRFGFIKPIQSEQDVDDLITRFEDLVGGLGALRARFRGCFQSGRSAAMFSGIVILGLIVAFNLSDILTWVFQDLFGLPNIVNWVSARISAFVAESAAAMGWAATWIGMQLKRASDGLANVQNLRTSIDDLLNSPAATKQSLIEAREELRNAKAAVAKAEQEVTQSTNRLKDVTKELERINAGGLVYDFLAAKLGASEYTKQLGLISTIREDFKNLGQLLEDWRKSQPVRDLQNRENDHPIKRVVLYIDDLDRCHPDRVVEVLQAVHLLLAYDLFVVVVAVDARWLEQSLYRVYAPEVLVATNGNDMAEKMETGEGFNPHNYLEKIFQIPFSIPPMAPENFEELMVHLAGEIAPPDILRELPEEIGPVEEVEPDTVSAPQLGNAETPASLPLEAGSTKQDSQQVSPAVSNAVAPVPALSDEEARCLGCMRAFIKTPRSAKRLVNLYRLIRIGGLDNAATSQNFLDAEDKSFVAVTLMVAINIAYPEVSRAFGDCIRIRSRGEIMYESGSSDVANFEKIMAELNLYFAHRNEESFLKSVEFIQPILGIKEKIPLKEFAEDLNAATNALRQADLDPNPISVEIFRNWVDEVERFSFNWS